MGKPACADLESLKDETRAEMVRRSAEIIAAELGLDDLDPRVRSSARRVCALVIGDYVRPALEKVAQF